MRLYTYSLSIVYIYHTTPLDQMVKNHLNWGKQFNINAPTKMLNHLRLICFSFLNLTCKVNSGEICENLAT